MPKWNPLDFSVDYLLSFTSCCQCVVLVPLVITFAIPSYSWRNEHARLLIVARKNPGIFDECLNRLSMAWNPPYVWYIFGTCILSMFDFQSINRLLEQLLFTWTLCFPPSNYRALKIIIIIYVDKFCNIQTEHRNVFAVKSFLHTYIQRDRESSIQKRTSEMTGSCWTFENNHICFLSPILIFGS